MSTDTWLSPEEVIELTARMRWKAQCKALQTMGLPFRPNAFDEWEGKRPNAGLSCRPQGESNE